MRGLGLPGWARAVIVPTSMNPNPNAASAGIATAFLSNPAAKPVGLGKLSPSTEQRSRGSSTSQHFRRRCNTDGCRPAHRNAAMAFSWADSGSSRNNKGRRSVPYQSGMRGDYRSTQSPRSEEHTSELQSRFGISYAVFSLKKQNKIPLEYAEAEADTARIQPGAVAAP